jgi:Tol biopolymer transport system component
MGRRSIVTCAALFACVCAPAEAQLVYSADGRLYEIDADGSDRSLLTTPTSHRASDAEADWSPDGQQLAVVYERNAADDFYRSRIDLLSADGSSRERVTELQRGVFVSSPRWSPDGDRLAFTRFTRRGDRYTSAIVVRDLSGDELTVVKQRLNRRLNNVGSPEWAPDGTTVLYSAFRLDRRAYFRSSIHIASLSGGPTRLLEREAHSPAFSADGSQIAFVSIADRNGEICGSDECFYSGELYVMDADGSNVQRLTRSKGDEMAPDWSADGGRIAFNSDRNFPDGFAHEIYSIAPDGTCLTWLTNGTASSVEPAWRPGGAATDPGGCGATPRKPLIEVDLGQAREFGSPRPLWLGLTHRGLLLSDVTHGRSEPLFFDYADCARYRPQDCPPGIEVMNQSVCSKDGSVRFLGDSGEQVNRRRRALVASFGAQGGITALTGALELNLFADPGGAAAVRAAFRALRPFPGEAKVERLPSPSIPAKLARQIRRVTRVYGRLGSVAATAEQLDLSRRTVRMRLDNRRALDDFGHRVRTVRC